MVNIERRVVEPPTAPDAVEVGRLTEQAEGQLPWQRDIASGQTRSSPRRWRAGSVVTPWPTA